MAAMSGDQYLLIRLTGEKALAVGEMTGLKG
jgi:hypothetical protein